MDKEPRITRTELPITGGDVSEMIFHGVMEGRMKVFGLTVYQILLLKHWYEEKTGKSAEYIK